MERQYIGARYVPILGGAWDSSKSYEALTIVQANNSSYTSKKPVPPGIDIANSEYWVLTGNFNGQVEEYRQEVEALAKKVENIETKRRFIFIGDSYGKNVERDGVMIKAWPSRVVETLRLSSDDAYIDAVSGAGFTVVGHDNRKFIDILRDIAVTVKTPETITDVLVVGGYNDKDNSDKIAGAVEAFRTKSKELFPNATVTLGFVGRNTMRDVDTGNKLYRARVAYANAVGCGYIANIEYSAPLSTMYVSDNVHPNNDGQLYIANAICKWILSGVYTCKFGQTTLTLGSDYTAPGGAIDGNQIILTLPALTISTGTFDTDFDYGKLNTSLLYCTLYNRKFPVVPIVTRDSTENVYVNGQGYLYVDTNRHLRLSILAQKAAGGTIHSYNYLQYPNTTVVLPCEFFM